MSNQNLEPGAVPRQSEYSNAHLAENMRCAIRTVAVAERLVAESIAKRTRRRAEGVHVRRRAFDGATPQSIYQPADESRSALWTTIETTVSEMREAGAPPEKVLVFVKRVLCDALRPDAPESTTTLPEDVVQWAIEAYFRAD